MLNLENFDTVHCCRLLRILSIPPTFFLSGKSYATEECPIIKYISKEQISCYLLLRKRKLNRSFWSVISSKKIKLEHWCDCNRRRHRLVK